MVMVWIVVVVMTMTMMMMMMMMTVMTTAGRVVHQAVEGLPGGQVQPDDAARRDVRRPPSRGGPPRGAAPRPQGLKLAPNLRFPPESRTESEVPARGFEV
jgi:hypothetical protein